MSSLLSGIRFGASSRADSDSDDDDRKKKKKKKDSKKKESKSHKKKSKENEDDSAPLENAPIPSTIERDEWMSMDFMGKPRQVELSAEEQKQQDEERKKQDEIDQGLREPNSGLLYGLYDPKTPQPVSALNSKPGMSSVGDGGASWKYKMLQRAKQRAMETGEPLENIVRAQYGMPLAELEAQAQGGGDVDAHLRYKRPEQTRSSRPEQQNKSGDKKLIKEYTSRMKFTNMSKESSKDSTKNTNDDDDEEPIDYSKLPDSDDDKKNQRGYSSRRRDDRHQRPRSQERQRSRERQPSRHRRSRSRERRRSQDRPNERNSKPKAKEPEMTKEQQEEAAKRAAFLYKRSEPSETKPLSPQQSAPAPPKSVPKQIESEAPMDLNKLAAKALKAKMRGDIALFETLTKQLNHLEHVQVQTSKRSGPPARAMVRQREELPHRAEDNAVGAKRGKRTGPGTAESLDDLVRQEKLNEGTDMDGVYMKNIIRLGARYEGTDQQRAKGGASGMDEEEDINMKMHMSSKSRLTERAYAEKSERAAINNRMNWDKAMQRCWHCPKSESFKSHLVLSMGEYVYLALPASSTVVDLQCVLVPSEHIQSISSADEDVENEIKRFKMALESFAKSQNQSMLYLERTYDASKRRHTVIHCVPVPLDIAADAPIYFKQAMMDCDEEWSTHKKIIDTSGKGIKRSIPAKFSYFHVEWADGGGYGHIIEDSSQFSADFGLDTIAGMLEVDPPRYGRYQPNLAAENERVRQFQSLWQPFDWTMDK